MTADELLPSPPEIGIELIQLIDKSINFVFKISLAFK